MWLVAGRFGNQWNKLIVVGELDLRVDGDGWIRLRAVYSLDAAGGNGGRGCVMSVLLLSRHLVEAA